VESLKKKKKLRKAQKGKKKSGGGKKSKKPTSSRCRMRGGRNVKKKMKRGGKGVWKKDADFQRREN